MVLGSKDRNLSFSWKIYQILPKIFKFPDMILLKFQENPNKRFNFLLNPNKEKKEHRRLSLFLQLMGNHIYQFRIDLICRANGCQSVTPFGWRYWQYCWQYLWPFGSPSSLYTIVFVRQRIVAKGSVSARAPSRTRYTPNCPCSARARTRSAPMRD